MALDALEGDSEFLSLHCNCRALLLEDRERRRAEHLAAKREAGGMSDTSPQTPGGGDDEDGVENDTNPELDHREPNVEEAALGVYGEEELELEEGEVEDEISVRMTLNDDTALMMAIHGK